MGKDAKEHDCGRGWGRESTLNEKECGIKGGSAFDIRRAEETRGGERRGTCNKEDWLARETKAQ